MQYFVFYCLKQAVNCNIFGAFTTYYIKSYPYEKITPFLIASGAE